MGRCWAHENEIEVLQRKVHRLHEETQTLLRATIAASKELARLRKGLNVRPKPGEIRAPMAVDEVVIAELSKALEGFLKTA
jgi:hypothetical protein